MSGFLSVIRSRLFAPTTVNDWQTADPFHAEWIAKGTLEGTASDLKHDVPMFTR
jgi:hypothetical protein